jgi:hypothetical protein
MDRKKYHWARIIADAIIVGLKINFVKGGLNVTKIISLTGIAHGS